MLQHTAKPHHRFCSRCKQELPATPDVFMRDASRPGGLAYECRACHSDRKRGRDNRSDRWAKHTPEQRAKCVARQSRWNRSDKGRAVFLAHAYGRIDKSKGHQCDIDRLFILNEIMPKPCTYCGTTEYPRGCDRIDNRLGHTKDNVVPACAACNFARGDRLSHEEMLVLGRVMAKIISDRTPN